MVVGEPGEPIGSCRDQTDRLKLPPGGKDGSRVAAEAFVTPSRVSPATVTMAPTVATILLIWSTFPNGGWGNRRRGTPWHGADLPSLWRRSGRAGRHPNRRRRNG